MCACGSSTRAFHSVPVVCHRDFGPAGILVRADQNPQEAAR